MLDLDAPPSFVGVEEDSLRDLFGSIGNLQIGCYRDLSTAFPTDFRSGWRAERVMDSNGVRQLLHGAS